MQNLKSMYKNIYTDPQRIYITTLEEEIDYIITGIQNSINKGFEIE